MMNTVGVANTALASSGRNSTVGRGSFVLCSFPEICLAVPQSDVNSIEHGTEFSVPEAIESAIAWFDSPRGMWPVCALDSQLLPRPALHASGSFLVFLNAHPIPVGLRCESVRVLRSGLELDTHQLPAVMQASGPGIVRGIARIDRYHLAMVVDENKLAAYLTQYVAQEGSLE
jgi:hypothetical protein